MTGLCRPYFFFLMVTTLELQLGSAPADTCPNNKDYRVVTTGLHPGKAWAEVNVEVCEIFLFKVHQYHEVSLSKDFHLLAQEFDSASDRVHDCPRCPGQGFGCFFFGKPHCPMTWEQAHQYCLQRGAQLAEPTDQYMSRYIANIFPYEFPDNHINNVESETLEVIVGVGQSYSFRLAFTIKGIWQLLALPNFAVNKSAEKYL